MKKLLLILFLIFLININSQAQNSSSTEVLPILIVSPNPATSTTIKFKFQRSYERGYLIQIYNFLGKKMFEARNLSEESNVNISDFNRGLYIYQLFDRRGKVVESGKFQVSRSS